ncbi:ribonuclease domain-containing protein [Streptomyces termitum]|uniref:ribonuclease domain-containing protein n=1 Tax=Streptomyces termitum TaxID=67368 RepID=UPI0033A477EF
MLFRPPRVLLALVLAVLLAGCSGGGTTTAPPTRHATASAPASLPAPSSASSSAVPSPAPASGVSGLPTVRPEALPPEARATLALIAKGGPYPYAKDGTVFGNFERVLPKRPRGYYHEYTVKTPGSRDRGARRIVTGRDGDAYYTDDHYESFREVVGGATG